MKQDNQEYSSRLLHYGYSQEEVDKIIEFRDSLEHCTPEQFAELLQQGIITRKKKLKKKRNYYVSDLGQIWYLNHYSKQFEVAGVFKEE